MIILGQTLKACVHYFLSNSDFSPNKSYEKYFLFQLKSSLHSQDIQIFVFWSSPLFYLSAIALEVDPRKILKFMVSSTV